MLEALLVPMLLAADWPQLPGPNRNGIYAGSDTQWPSQFAWQVDVGSGFAGLVIAGGKVILFHRNARKEIVEAFDVRTGKSVWSFDYPTNYKDDYGHDDGPRSPATVAGDKVFTYGAEGVLHALDLATGAKLWRVDVSKQYNVAKGFFGAGCAPLVTMASCISTLDRRKRASAPSTSKQES